MIRLVALVLCLFALVLPLGASGGKQSQFSFANTIGGNTGQADTYLEEYTPFDVGSCTLTTCVVNRVPNPTDSPECAWDVNDHYSLSAAPGYLPPGASAAITACLISYSNPTYSTLYPDFQPPTYSLPGGVHGWAGVSVDVVGSSSLIVSVCWQPQGRCFSPAPKVVSTARNGTSTYEWDFCGQAVYNGQPNLDPALGPMPNSNGGYGLQTTVTVSVTNTSTATIKTVNANWGVSSDFYFPAACPTDINVGTFKYNVQFDYPFAWIQS